MLVGAIIPTLMHRNPSELYSYACFDESSTRKGDLWEVPELHPFLLLRNFFAWLIAYDGPARSLCMHPILFLRVFFAGLVVYVIPTLSIYMHAPL